MEEEFPSGALLVKVININYNKANGVLKGMNMLIVEYDYDTDIAVQREEERETAFAEGEEKGAHRKALETAKAMKVEGFASGLIAKITGLDEETINRV